MDHPGSGPRFVHLATMGDLMAARVIAARLESDGIEVRVHGEALGPYRLTIGDLALTELWVAVEHLDEARRLMLEAEVDGVLGSIEEQPDGEPALPVGVLMVISLILLVILAYRAFAAIF